MYPKISYIIVLLFISFQSNESTFHYSDPKTPNNSEVIKHIEYSLSYNCKHEQANWISYKLERQEVLTSRQRTNDFRVDHTIECTSSTLSDYKGSGYDRGHLSPAADNKETFDAMSESFLMSNISPMLPQFNRNYWLKLEKQVREWAIDRDEVYVVVGPILSDNLPTIGNNVSIPKYFYKIVLDPEPLEYVAYLMENTNKSQDFNNCVVTIDSIETLTGIDFFPDSGIEELESIVNEWK